MPGSASPPFFLIIVVVQNVPLLMTESSMATGCDLTESDVTGSDIIRSKVGDSRDRIRLEPPKKPDYWFSKYNRVLLHYSVSIAAAAATATYIPLSVAMTPKPNRISWCYGEYQTLYGTVEGI
jgi:hypothetical protein